MRACRVCGDDGPQHVYHSEPLTSEVLRCRSCGHTYAAKDILEEFLIADYNDAEAMQTWADTVRQESAVRLYRKVTYRLTTLVDTDDVPTVHDVGAGSGGFLKVARELGWRIQGNEISRPFAEMARQDGVDLYLGALGEEQRSSSVDAVTLFCVLAHVQNSGELVREAHRVLAPGGIIFVRTPAWCAIERLGQFLLRISRGRWSSIMDHRMNLAHLQIFTERSITKQLESAGFTLEQLETVCEYACPAEVYLRSFGIPALARRLAGRALDALIDRRLFLRNTIHVYARKVA